MQKRTIDTDALSMYRLPFDPPVLACARDYIIRAIQKNDKRWVLFFLHRFEAYFNRRIVGFVRRNGVMIPSDMLTEMKAACREEVLFRYESFDVSKGSSFLAYIDPFIKDAVLNVCRKNEEWSSSSLSDYKRVRTMGAIYNACGRIPTEAVKRYCEQYGVTEETAWNMLDAARRLENSGKLCFNDPQLDYDFLGTLSNGIRIEEFVPAFRRLPYNEQILLEACNCVCMGCYSVFPEGKHPTYKDLAEKGENSDPETSSRQYKKAVNDLIYELTDDGVIGCVLICLKHADEEQAIYSYEPDNGGHVGEIIINRVNGDFEITVFPEKDAGNSTWQMEEAIAEAVLKEPEPPEELLIPLHKYRIEETLRIRVKQKSLKRKNKQNISAVYAYRKGTSTPWGIIRFDFINHESEVTVFPAKDGPYADWSTEDAICKAVFAKADGELPKNLLI